MGRTAQGVEDVLPLGVEVRVHLALEAPRLVGRSDEADIRIDDPQAVEYTYARQARAPFNVTGQPAISVPLHQSEEGLPIGMQLVAAPAREDVLIRLAAQLEQAHPWADRRPVVWSGEIGT